MDTGRKRREGIFWSKHGPCLVSGGTMGLYLNDLIQIDDVTVGRFPDPEPRRVHRLANRHNRPVYFIEPEIDDPQWEEHMIAEAKEVSSWRKLLAMRINWEKVAKESKKEYL